jgi:hypothetical protein
MNGQTTPQFVQAILEWQWTWPIARFALVVFYLCSGLSKIANFRGAVAEMVEARMPVPAGPGREDLKAMLRVAEGLRDHVKALLKATQLSWERGHAETTH